MTALAAIALCCTALDTNVAAAVYAEAIAQRVDPALVLAISCVESSTSGKNPLGVMLPAPSGRGQVACGRTGQFSAVDCIAIGVRSLANRLRAAGGDEAKALRIYNGGARKGYAGKVLRIVRFLRRGGR